MALWANNKDVAYVCQKITNYIIMLYSYLSYGRSVLSRNEKNTGLPTIRTLATEVSSLETDISVNINVHLRLTYNILYEMVLI